MKKLGSEEDLHRMASNYIRWHYPDTLLMIPAKNGGTKLAHYGGLFIELKKDGTRLKKMNGDWASGRIAEQAAVLEGLRKRGCKAEFAVGFDGAKKIIDEYLGGRL
jgi:hypothetical protein